MSMIDQPIAIAHPLEEPLPLLGKLHEWVVTVDHKRLGIMYLTCALVFLVVGSGLLWLGRRREGEAES